MKEDAVGHYPVMADEMERYLFGEGGPAAEGAYCDCTAGAGGYARRVLRRAAGRRLVAIDRDRDAIELCRRRLGEFGNRVSYFRGSFSKIEEAARGSLPLAGIVADLGLSLIHI